MGRLVFWSRRGPPRPWPQGSRGYSTTPLAQRAWLTPDGGKSKRSSLSSVWRRGSPSSSRRWPERTLPDDRAADACQLRRTAYDPPGPEWATARHDVTADEGR